MIDQETIGADPMCFKCEKIILDMKYTSVFLPNVFNPKYLYHFHTKCFESYLRTFNQEKATNYQTAL